MAVVSSHDSRAPITACAVVIELVAALSGSSAACAAAWAPLGACSASPSALVSAKRSPALPPLVKFRNSGPVSERVTVRPGPSVRLPALLLPA